MGHRSVMLRLEVSVDGDAPSAILSEVEAEALALATGAGADPRARLSWEAVGPARRLVWTVVLWQSASRHLAAPSVRIDAATGSVLSVREGAAFAAPVALAYPNNPVVDAAPAVVELPWVGEALADPELAVRPCQDLGEVATFEGREGPYALRVCTPTDPPAVPVGGFLDEPILEPPDPARDEDTFSAAHTYWNLHVGFEWFRAHGWAPNGSLEARVNYRRADRTSELTATDPEHPLFPFPNAYMTPSFDASPSLVVFGQGDPGDLSYDADLVHHELGHFVIHTARALWYTEPTSFGPSREAQALAEGFCDYFSAAIHGDPVFAEYAGQVGQAEGDSRSRDLSADATCGEDLRGDPHLDSLPFSSALWAVRATLADPAPLDAAVLDALPALGTEASFAEAVEVLAARADEVGLGEAVRAELTARGVDACAPVIDVTDGEAPATIAVPASNPAETAGPIPSYVQLRAQIPDGGATLTLRYTQRVFLGYDPVPTPLAALGVVGASVGALTWTLGAQTGPLGAPVDVWQTDASPLPSPVEVEVREDPENPLRRLHDYAVTFRVTTAGPYTVQLTNAEPYDVVVFDPSLTLDTVGSPDSPDPRCGCQAAPPAGLWVLGWVAAVRRRRSLPPRSHAPALPARLRLRAARALARAKRGARV